MIGSEFVGYRLAEVLRIQDSGEIYRAEHIHLKGQSRIIKLFSMAWSTDESRVEQVRKFAGLKHPALVGIENLGSQRNRYFIIFEPVSAESLLNLKRRLSTVTVFGLLQQLTHCLEYLRDNGCPVFCHCVLNSDAMLVDDHNNLKLWVAFDRVPEAYDISQMKQQVNQFLHTLIAGAEYPEAVKQLRRRMLDESFEHPGTIQTTLIREKHRWLTGQKVRRFALAFIAVFVIGLPALSYWKKHVISLHGETRVAPVDVIQINVPAPEVPISLIDNQLIPDREIPAPVVNSQPRTLAARIQAADGMLMILIPADQPYYIDEHEVTNDQYFRFCKSTGHSIPKTWNGTYPDGTGRQPVTRVSLKDAKAYAARAGKKVPTEQQWEYAARGGLQNQRYTWGGEWRSGLVNGIEQFTGQEILDSPAWKKWKAEWDENTTGGLKDVKSFPPNGYGLHEMLGNAQEWCDSLYDQAQPDKGYVQRGGCCISIRNDLTVTSRRPAAAAAVSEFVGFRCVKAVE